MNRTELLTRFPVGTRVRLSDAGIRAGISKCREQGVVVGFTRHWGSDAIRVLRDGVTTAVAFRATWWEPVVAQQIEEHW